MRLYGLIGYPLSHSFSKKYFTEKFEKEGIKGCAYELFPIPSIDELPALLAQYPELCGFNITIPYKEQVLSYLQHQNDKVKDIQACNCVRIDDGILTGYNTDVLGFEQSLLQLWKPHHDRALILGTGGVSKAVEYVLRNLKIEYTFVSRRSTGDHLSYDQLTADIIKSHPLIINTTPLGTYPNTTEAPPIPYTAITDHHYLFDMVYNPARTVFLQKGEEHGAIIKNGYDMLEIQAEESWNIWNQ